MFLALLYHKATPELVRHLEWIASRYRTLHPGDPILPRSICLTFDDATADFYHEIYPHLQKHSLKALLAVPTGLIDTPGHCTWDQLRELAASPLITIASHSATHPNMTDPNVDLTREILGSKRALEQELSCPISTFVYPYGRYNSSIHREVMQHYDYIMPIRSAYNNTWDHPEKMVFRVPADELPSPSTPFRRGRLLRYLLKNCILKICP